MISRIKGVLLRRELEQVEVMTPGGVGYVIEVPLSTYERLPAEGTEVELFTHYVVREDAASLYGFADVSERALFARLLTASGIGPKLALSILSTLAPDRLIRAITERDIATLRQAPGLGPKKAERLALELADKLDDLSAIAVGPTPQGRDAEEAVGALVALGYSPALATAGVRKALDEDPSLQGAALIKAALAKVS